MEARKLSDIQPVRFEDSASRVIAGVKERFTPARRAQIPALWQRFAPNIGKVPGQVGHITYGVITMPSPESEEFDYMAGVEVTDAAALPRELTTIRVPAQRYAVFTHGDHVSRISETMWAIHDQWLPRSGYEAVPAPVFERYGEKFDPQTGRGDIELWVPVQRKK